MPDPPLDFIKRDPRSGKPRTRGITEVRGPYRTVMGKRYFADLFETVGPYIDSIEFAGGTYVVIARPALIEMIELAHNFDVQVSAGGFIERVLTQGSEAVNRYLQECKDVGFDTVEPADMMISISRDDRLRLVSRIRELKLQAEVVLAVHTADGVGGPRARATAAGVASAIQDALLYIDAGAHRVLFLDAGVTDNANEIRGEIVGDIISSVGAERVVFAAAAGPAVAAWYVQTFGPGINLFVDHTQVLQLEALRAGIWGSSAAWGRVVSYEGAT